MRLKRTPEANPTPDYQIEGDSHARDASDRHAPGVPWIHRGPRSCLVHTPGSRAGGAVGSGLRATWKRARISRELATSRRRQTKSAHGPAGGAFFASTAPNAPSLSGASLN